MKQPILNKEERETLRKNKTCESAMFKLVLAIERLNRDLITRPLRKLHTSKLLCSLFDFLEFLFLSGIAKLIFFTETKRDLLREHWGRHVEDYKLAKTLLRYELAAALIINLIFWTILVLVISYLLKLC